MSLPVNYQPVKTNDNHEEGTGVNRGMTTPLLGPVSTLRQKRGLRVALVFVVVLAMIYSALRTGLLGGCLRRGKHGSGLASHYVLPSGDKIPSVALGVWRAERNEVGEAVKAALEAGYRHIDGAWIYGNEAEVGQALKESGIARDKIWITSKLWNTFHSPEDIERVLDESLSRLGTNYLDLYLIHWPVASNLDGKPNEQLTEDPYPTWQKLEELVEKGKIRNIGVSNFNVRRLQNLTANPLKLRPAVNQIELNFWLPQQDLIRWSKENGLLLEAYSPLGSAERVGASLNVPVVKEIASKLGITPAQVLISWHVQRGTVVLPKSVQPARIVENLQLTRLPEDLFQSLEKAASSHPPQRGSDPSKKWGVDIFDELDSDYI